jgi:hypothetical protein
MEQRRDTSCTCAACVARQQRIVALSDSCAALLDETQRQYRQLSELRLVECDRQQRRIVRERQRARSA